MTKVFFLVLLAVAPVYAQSTQPGTGSGMMADTSMMSMMGMQGMQGGQMSCCPPMGIAVQAGLVFVALSFSFAALSFAFWMYRKAKALPQ